MLAPTRCKTDRQQDGNCATCAIKDGLVIGKPNGEVGASTGRGAYLQPSLAETDRAYDRKRILDFGCPSFDRIGDDTLVIARLKYPADEARVRWELDPWIVDRARERMEGTQLSAAEQREVWKVTRTPDKVAWPQWWNYFGE